MGTALLVDGNNYIQRAFFKVPPLTTKDGVPTNAVKGFFNILLADIKKIRPTHIVVAFDKPSKTIKNWRKEVYPEYKANRSRAKMDPKSKERWEQISVQFKPIRLILKAMGIRVIGKEGHEADDLIGTLAVKLSRAGHNVVIGSKDKDFAQLVNNKVSMLDSEDRSLIDARRVKELYGVPPSQIIEYLALMGDTVDNVPGVVKCGGVTAAKWLNLYGSIKGIKKNKDELTPVLKANFVQTYPFFKTSLQVLKINTEVNIKMTSESSAIGEPDVERLDQICSELSLRETHRQILVVLNNELSTSKHSNNVAIPGLRF